MHPKQSLYAILLFRCQKIKSRKQKKKNKKKKKTTTTKKKKKNKQKKKNNNKQTNLRNGFQQSLPELII